VATKKVDQASAWVKFKLSPDGGTTFGAIVNGVFVSGATTDVGTIPKVIPILIRERRGGRLEVLDGSKALFFSEDSGETWEPVV
jgi:hypothetical protein